MLISKEVKIDLNQFNSHHYKRKGYDVDGKDSIMVEIKDVGKGSTIKIESECDICGEVKSLSYRTYLRNISSNNIYACSNKCAVTKGEMTCLKKYGTKYALQNEEVKEKTKQYFLDTYGVENTSQLESVKAKREKTMVERFGVKTNIILPETHKKAIEASCSDESKNRRKETMIEKYGVDNYSKTEEYSKRTKETNNELYGVDHPMKSDIIKDRFKENTLEKYGVDHPMKIKEFALKAGKASLESKIKRGIAVDKSNIEEWKNYNSQVRKLTHRNKRELFEKWDGIDYYDGECILEYLNLEHIDERYPCVDHKRSILDGFKNNIPIEEMSRIENLCITKRSLNSRKKSSNEEDFFSKIDI